MSFRPHWAPPPAILIRLQLEEPVRVEAVWDRDADGDRLFYWLDAHPELDELVALAVELAGKKGAA